MPETPRGADETPLAEDDAGAQRRTTPLRRDNSRIADPDSGSADGGTSGSDLAGTSSGQEEDATPVTDGADTATRTTAEPAPIVADDAVVDGVPTTAAAPPATPSAPQAADSGPGHELGASEHAPPPATGGAAVASSGAAHPSDATSAAVDPSTGQRATAADFAAGVALPGNASAAESGTVFGEAGSGPRPADTEPHTDQFPVVVPQKPPTAVYPPQSPHSSNPQPHAGAPVPAPAPSAQYPAAPPYAAQQQSPQVPAGAVPPEAGQHGQAAQPAPPGGPPTAGQAHGKPRPGSGMGTPTGGPATAQQPAVGTTGHGQRAVPWTWAIRGLVLFAVALVSGIAWWAFGPGGSSAEDEKPPPPSGPDHEFNLLQKEGWLPGCAQVATDKIEDFFQDQECVHRTRALYTTTLDNGDRVVTTVTTVLMPDKAKAGELDGLLTEEATGNINDLVDQGMATEEDLPELNDKAYDSEQQGELVVIGDSAYLDRDTPENDPRLLRVTSDALQLGWPQDRQQ